MAYQGKFSQARNTRETIQPQKETAPAVRTDSVKKSGGKKKTKGNRNITIIFYTVYFVMVAAILVGLIFANHRLKHRLIAFEASRPTARCEEIFQANFADPDWAALYNLVGLSDTAYEGSEAFAAYMEAKIGTNKLTYAEAPASLSRDHQYLLKAGDEIIGSFTLVKRASGNATTSDWQLGQVSLNYTYAESVTVRTGADTTVYVNGVALSDDHTIQIDIPGTEEYLPQGVHGPRIYTHYLDGLMVKPQVTATDADGNPLDVIYDVEKDEFLVLPPENTISDEESEQVLMTARTFALRMTETADEVELDKYFDTDSDIYKAIVSAEPWLQEGLCSSYEWDRETISGYCRYSDDLFSAHVELSLSVTCTDGSVQEYTIYQEFFFESQDGTWKCINMTDADIREQITLVRLTFMLGDTVIFTNLFEEDVSTLVLPTVTAPEGQVFTGWYRLDTAADGSAEYTQVFGPDQGGTIHLPAGTALKPMTLYALFENTNDNGGNQ